jgi:hypothetical protein
MKCYNWSIALYRAVKWTLRKAHQNYLENFEMRCWRRMEISWNDQVNKKIGNYNHTDRNEEELTC